MVAREGSADVWAQLDLPPPPPSVPLCARAFSRVPARRWSSADRQLLQAVDIPFSGMIAGRSFCWFSQQSPSAPDHRNVFPIVPERAPLETHDSRCWYRRPSSRSHQLPLFLFQLHAFQLLLSSAQPRRPAAFPRKTPHTHASSCSMHLQLTCKQVSRALQRAWEEHRVPLTHRRR